MTNYRINIRIAVLSDVHGNIYALEAVARDISYQRVDVVVFLGDIAFFGLYPQECFDLLKELKAHILIKGNTDANFEEFADFSPRNDFENYLYRLIEYADTRLTSEAKQSIQKWPLVDRNTISNNGFLFCHGSPYSFKDQLTEESKADFTKRIENESAQTLFCGHTHKRSNFTIGEKRVINFGAVGYSFDGDTQAHYGIIDTEKTPAYEFKSINYEIEHYKIDIRRQNPPFRNNLLYALENGAPAPL